jgi:hypothetical protein
MALDAAQVQEVQAALQLLSQFLPVNIQPIVKDVAVDAPLAFVVYTQIAEAVAKFPPRATRTAVSIVTAFGIPAGTPVYSAAQLLDSVVTQVEAAKVPA